MNFGMEGGARKSAIPWDFIISLMECSSWIKAMILICALHFGHSTGEKGAKPLGGTPRLRYWEEILEGFMKFNLKKVLAKSLLRASLTLFLVPGLSLAFVMYGEAQLDADYQRALLEDIENRMQGTADEKSAATEFVKRVPVSFACASSDPGLDSYRAATCERFSAPWQFFAAKRVSWIALILGIAALVATVVLGAVAFYNRAAQYLSFLVGRRLLTLVSGVEIVLQGALCVWLSFWVTALLANQYYVKLVGAVAIFACAVAWVAIRALFLKPSVTHEVEGEVVTEAGAPKLWQRIRSLAQQIGTEPPTHLVAGIDDGFFVCEAPLKVGETTLNGRNLYMSIPLIRQLDAQEADVIFGHELAHFKGGDTKHGAAVGLEILRFDFYLRALRHQSASFLSLGLLELYRVIFELALKRESRDREFVADKEASGVTSPEMFGRALAKVVAYSRYRAHIEQELFDGMKSLEGDLSIAQAVDAGFVSHAQSDAFLDELKEAKQAHPFDSHPALSDRLQAVGLPRGFEGSIMKALVGAPSESWASDIHAAEEIERKLWSVYDERFKQRHEEVLAYRYKPTNAEEQAHIEKFFPALEFPTKRAGTLRLSFKGITPMKSDEFIPFELIEKVWMDAGWNGIGRRLVLESRKPGATKRLKTRILVDSLGKNKDPFFAAFNKYYHRDQIARGAS